MTGKRLLLAAGGAGFLVALLPVSSDGAATNSAPAQHAQNIVVTASRVGTESYRVPAAVSVISGDAIHKAGVANYQQALADVPGVRINARQENDMGVPGIEVRGLGSNPMSGGNVMILLDGIPQRRLSFGGPYVGSLPGDSVTRMELVKGPAASLYGRGAMSGALQLFTSPGTADWGLDLWSTYETGIDQFRSVLRVSGPLTPDRASTFSLTGSRTEVDGWQDRTEGDRTDAYLHARLVPGDSDTIDITAGYVDSYQEKAAPVLIDKSGHRLPGIDRDENLSVPGQNSGDVKETRVATVWERAISESLNSRLSLAYWGADTTWKVGRPDDAPASGTILSRSSSNRDWQEDSWFSEYQLSGNYNLGRHVEGTLLGGGSLEQWTYRNRYQSIWSPGSDATRGILLDLNARAEPDPSTWIYGKWGDLNTRELDYGVFLRNRTTIGRQVDVELGGRYDGYRRTQHDRVNDTFSTIREDALSPSAGLAYHFCGDKPDLSTAYASWGRGFWPVYRNVGPAEIAEIPPETSTSYELGLKNALFDKRVLANVALYRQERNNVVGTDPATQKPGNVGDWRISGVEADLRIRLPGHVTLCGTYTRRLPEIERDLSAPATEGNDIPLIARDMFTLGIACEPPRGWFAGVDSRHVGDSWADTRNTIRLQSYHVLDARIGYTWRAMSATLFARNLLDEEYLTDAFLGIKNGSAFEGAPRTVGASVNARF